MTPWLVDPDVTLYHGDVLATLREMPDESVDCVVTSPPYWGLRDYGTGAWEGGDAECDHAAPLGGGTKASGLKHPDNALTDETIHAKVERIAGQYRDTCGKCGATRIDQQLGLEPTPEQYVERMVEVFREVRRVLVPHGTVWLNLGDSYATTPPGKVSDPFKTSGLAGIGGASYRESRTQLRAANMDKSYGGLKQKDLVGIPWRVAFALQADGWYLRSDIIWAKPNPMPESVTDRPTKSHEYLFLLSKNPRYYFDQEAVREDVLALSDGASPNRVLSPTQSQQLLSDLQGLREEAGGGMALHSNGAGQDERGQSALRQNEEGSASATGSPGIRDAAVADGDLSAESRGTRGSEAGESVGGRTGTPTPLFPEREGQGGDAPEAASQETLERGGSNADHRGVGRDQGSVSPSVRVLPPGEAADAGSRYPVEQGRESHEGERGASVPELQRTQGQQAGRNIRSVWLIATQPYPEAHFATFPEELARRCIAAGCPEQVCRVCGKARERITKTEIDGNRPKARQNIIPPEVTKAGQGTNAQGSSTWGHYLKTETLGFTDCGHADYRPGIVLDPFIGSGTVAHVARKLGRHSIGIDLNAEYLALAARRLQQQSLFADAF